MTLAQALEPDPDDRHPDRIRLRPQPRKPDPMTAIKVRLGDLGLAPENLRFKEPADDGVPQLADTLAAAGVISRRSCGPAGRASSAFMALDGRRRRFGLLLLARPRRHRRTTIEVDCLLAETKAQQVAGIMLPATEHAPVHIADVITRHRQAAQDQAGHRAPSPRPWATPSWRSSGWRPWRPSIPTS